jgi:anti-anti-sigma regulatory factor
VLRITTTGSNAISVTAKIEGEIAGAHVHELFRSVASALARAPHVVLDLSDVTFVDHAGAVLLRSLTDQGVQFVHGSSYISRLLGGPVAEFETGGSE